MEKSSLEVWNLRHREIFRETLVGMYCGRLRRVNFLGLEVSSEAAASTEREVSHEWWDTVGRGRQQASVTESVRMETVAEV